MSISKNRSQLLVIVAIILYFLFEYFDHGQNMLERINLRTTGPFHLRLIFQPLGAIILGTRDGIKDARKNIKPYLFNIITDNRNRSENLRKGLKSLTIPLIIGILLDAVFQLMVLDRLHLFGAFIFGIVLIAFPLLIFQRIKQPISLKTI